ncbi:methyltransferase domain-containing protein [Streptomyces celluloflavus]|uniref:hypothetical protein n=1 Tax=Streptomyces celluloflavus TaxID=58344 RepID=UPI0036B513B2
MIADTELDRFTRYCLTRRGRIATDAGCGSGAFTRQLHHSGFDWPRKVRLDPSGHHIVGLALGGDRLSDIPSRHSVGISRSHGRVGEQVRNGATQ